MIYLALRHCIHGTASCLKPPAEIYLFHVGKETPVEAACILIGPATYHHRSTGSPEHTTRIVVLAFVLLDCVEHPATAKGITVTVDKTARCTGILEERLVTVGQYLRLASCRFGMRLHEIEQRDKPAGSNLHVGIKQNEIFGIYKFQCLVIPFGKSIVAAKLQQAHLRKIRLHDLQRVIGRAIIGNNHKGFLRIFQDRRKELAQHTRAVVIQYDNRDLLHL